MEGPPLRLMIDPAGKPVAFHSPIPVPLHWQEDVKAGLDQDTRLGVIEPVPVGDPVTWCHRMVICAKKNGKPRRTVDLQPLNAHAVRETHHTQSPFHQARLVPHGKKKTVFDCWNGYHSVPLHENDRHLTTFITPWGRYRYRVAPQGYIASGDGYTRRFDEIVSDIPDKTKCVDDTLLWADTLVGSFWQAVNWLDICGRHGITLNPEKFVFGQDEVTFAGFEITSDSVKPARPYLDAIHNFPTPSNITDVRSWFGLINQVLYAFASANRMLPFRNLLKQDTPFLWNKELDQLFEESKSVIVKEIEEGVQIFDKSKPTCLATGWSKTGIGFWLFQKHCECLPTKPFCCRTGWRTTLVGSRFTHPNEANYAPVEGEALAVVDGLDKARFFVLGCDDLIVAVDHKPLLKILSDRSLNDIENPRLRNLKEKTLRYRFTIVHVPGVKHKAADAVSRHPSGSVTPETPALPDDMAHMENSPSVIDCSFLASIRCTEPAPALTLDAELQSTKIAALESLQATTWDHVKLATDSDVHMFKLLSIIEEGFPDGRDQLPSELQEYHQFREYLWTVDGVILYKDRVVIPPSLRKDILSSLHSAHQGVTNMTARAESSIFWPGITQAIISMRRNCNDCNRNAPSQPSAPPTTPFLPAYPFQCVCADYFKFQGRNYLVAIDRYSNWPIIERGNDGSNGLINNLRHMFGTYGIPDELASDGGPEFTSSTTTRFLKDWGVNHRLSSVAFPHSNCRAEIGVKTVKRLIMSNTGPCGELDTDAFQRAVLQYRNTPDPETKLSPAMCVFGRPIKDFIPILPGRYRPHPTWRSTLAAREDALRNRHMKMAERLSEHTRRLPPLTVGNRVRIQNQTGSHPTKWDNTGIVAEVCQFDQYAIRVDGSGRITIRNRKFLKKYLPVQQPLPRCSIAEDLKLLPVAPQKSSVTLPPVTTPKPTVQMMLPLVPSPAPALRINVPTGPSSTQRHCSVPPASVLPPVHEPHPDADVSAPTTPPASTTPLRKKIPFALRRLMDYNARGLKE